MLLSKILILIGGNTQFAKNRSIKEGKMGNKEIWENLGKMGKMGNLGKTGNLGNLGKYREKVTEKFPVGSLGQRVGNPSVKGIEDFVVKVEKI